MKKAITILAICSLLLTACGQIDDTESKSETTTAIASESTAGEDTAETSSAKEEKDTSEATTTTKKSSHGILIFKDDGYYCNYYKEIRFVRCFGKLNSGTKQFRAE